MPMEPERKLLLSAEVARLFHVSPRTVNRWATIYEMDDIVIRTLGGHHRYDEAAVYDILAGRRQLVPRGTQ